ncbi:flagellar hook-length control protein FliK [Herminiimonas fonticola]|uniref:Flagellar hook-length control protein FliK n=1 Tax=Herminiimonas fonticola TaxID=303380 RepID=A0A4R6GIU4_9BURK|nr:flagellar hook-length control protein FliK [Herminiimonas fonticola]RBA25798.1 Flagellar hook-length control protein [Herminiimonas fonticola]TDN94906.1 flagellar hook-length control protein FliK [Herminiimonas fonticola]
MNTPAINSPLAVLTPAANNSKQDASASSEAGAFNQVLTREIADRNNAGNTNNEVSKNTQKDTSGKDDKSANGTTNNAGNASEASGTTDAAKATDDDKAAALVDGKKEDADAIVAGPSAELLAFVAALTQANTAVAQTPVTDAAVETAASAKITDIDAKLDTTLGIGTTATTISEKDAIGKKSDFVAALDKAATAAGDGSKAPVAAATSAKPEVDLAAAVAIAVPKTAETVANPQAIAAVSTAALQQLAETSAVHSNKLAPQVGSPDWSQALGQKVVWMVQGAQQTATLTLNPPDLGPMQVTLNVANNQATANFTAHQPEVRHALEAAMPRLREMLNDAGIQLGQSNVSAGTQNQQNAFSEQRQGGRQSGQNSNAAEPVVHVSHVPVPTVGNGIVDTFA